MKRRRLPKSPRARRTLVARVRRRKAGRRSRRVPPKRKGNLPNPGTSQQETIVTTF